MLTFWELTPAETLAEIEAALWRAERQRQHEMSLAWHTAALTRSKRMPGLRALMGGGETKPLTPEEAEERQAEHERMAERVKAQMEKMGGRIRESRIKKPEAEPEQKPSQGEETLRREGAAGTLRREGGDAKAPGR